MKKILIVTLVLLLGLSATGFAQSKGWALGGAFAFDWAGSNAYPTRAALVVKFPGLPIMFGFSANFEDPVVVGVTADWWLFTTHLVGPVNLYLGPGLFLRFATEGGTDPVFGIRIPIGFQIYIVKAFEIFLEPAVAIELLPTLPDFSLQAALGFRFWF